jgi:hypothetical protein
MVGVLEMKYADIDWKKFWEWRNSLKPTAVIYKFSNDELFWYNDQLFMCVGNGA